MKVVETSKGFLAKESGQGRMKYPPIGDLVAVARITGMVNLATGISKKFTYIGGRFFMTACFPTGSRSADLLPGYLLL